MPAPAPPPRQCRCEADMAAPSVTPRRTHPPIFSGVGHPTDELHSLGVVVGLCMQAQEPLYKVSGGHVMLAVLVHDAGMLQRGDAHAHLDTPGEEPEPRRAWKSLPCVSLARKDLSQTHGSRTTRPINFCRCLNRYLYGL